MYVKSVIVPGCKQVIAKLVAYAHRPGVRQELSTRGTAAVSSPFAVYFSGAPDDIYQLVQWLRTLEHLDATGTGVTLLMSNATSVRSLLRHTRLPVRLCTTSAQVESFVIDHHVKAMFYVNNNQANFTTLRINGLVHIHLSHGESEKSSMVSHQLKAYDFIFIAGDAARERILGNIPRLDPKSLIVIGRPQLDVAPEGRKRRDPHRLRVLYAPTWEGDSPAMAYGSLARHGLTLAKALTSDERVDFAFRPHPKTGDISPEHKHAAREVSRLAAGSSPHPEEALKELSWADVVITDISAMAMDAVGLQKPIVVFMMSARPASRSTSGLCAVVPTWSTVPGDAVDQLIKLAGEGPSTAQNAYREHVFGVGSAGTATARFVTAAKDLLTT